ncbi:MAG TPA: glutamate-cysteine ligase family protein [Alphaproteobacteria bacterium]|nr:glutamate-cysteine ligase family protein [Alphaproteobacteria bacterium]
MSRVFHAQNPDQVFQNRAEIETHLLAKVMTAQGGKTGTELELFVTTPEGRPPSFDQIEMLLENIALAYKGAEMTQEKGRIVGLNLPGIGDISLEPGGQVELSTKPCDTVEELEQCNRALRRLLDGASAFLDLHVEGAGHKPAFLQADDMPRSRFHAYYAYCHEQYGKKAQPLIDTMKSCCGLQVNVDPMGDKFHEIYRALLLTDVAESFATRSERQKRLHETYASVAPEQMTPVFDALACRDNDTLVGHIVDRLLSLRVPFVPDETAPEGFRAAREVFGKTMTVGDFLTEGKLSVQILDNALSLQLTMPNLRRHGVLETRAPDSMDDIGTLMKTAAQYHRMTYDDTARRALLDDFASVDADRLRVAFLSRFDMDAKTLMAFDIGGGKTVGQLVTAVRGADSAPEVAAEATLAARTNRRQPQQGA